MESCFDPPIKKMIITYRWVIKTKLDANSQLHTGKTWLVGRGCSQKFGKDYDETYAPDVKYNTIRILLALAAMKKMHVR